MYASNVRDVLTCSIGKGLLISYQSEGNFSRSYIYFDIVLGKAFYEIVMIFFFSRPRVSFEMLRERGKHCRRIKKS